MPEGFVLLGGSMNPPCKHHYLIAQALSHQFPVVFVVPCGFRTDGKKSTNVIDPVHRAEMTKLTFGQLPGVSIDLSDVDAPDFTKTFDLYHCYSKYGPTWLYVGGDLIRGGRNGQSPIQREWYRGRELWETSQFVVIPRGAFEQEDLPPRSHLIKVTIPGASSTVRDRIKAGQPFDDIVTPGVAQYIHEHGLYR